MKTYAAPIAFFAAAGLTPLVVSDAFLLDTLVLILLWGCAAGAWNITLGSASVGIDDLMLFCRQMNTLLKSGVPIIRALAGLREASSNPALSVVLIDLRDNLEAGREMSIAMQRHAKVFSRRTTTPSTTCQRSRSR